MITKNGHQKISKIIIIFLLIVYSNNSRAENANFEPQINLNEILPSYDEEIYDEENNKSQEQDIIDLNSDMKLSPFASISVLNKITAEVVSIDLKLKESYLHEKLRIFAIDCYNSPPLEKKEIAVYLNIYLKDSNEKIFNGWMIKSLPSISSMEHPIYDIWIDDCYGS